MPVETATKPDVPEADRGRWEAQLAAVCASVIGSEAVFLGPSLKSKTSPKGTVYIAYAEKGTAACPRRSAEMGGRYVHSANRIRVTFARGFTSVRCMDQACGQSDTRVAGHNGAWMDLCGLE
jgi:nicotinamide mononucleotide (NMN) deamidase PncC